MQYFGAKYFRARFFTALILLPLVAPPQPPPIITGGLGGISYTTRQMPKKAAKDAALQAQILREDEEISTIIKVIAICS